MKVIALSGWKQSGKDTAADYLIKEHGFLRFGFADILKDMVAEQYNIPRESLDKPELKEQPLFQYPVNPQDDFSCMIAKFLVKEFATKFGNGEIGKQTSQFSEPWQHFDLFWTPRALAILEGSVKRSVTSQYWVQQVINQINNLKTPSKLIDGEAKGNFVITDLRYRSEVAQLEEAFGENLQVVRISRFDSSPSSDPSERDLDDYKFSNIIENKGTLEELYTKVDKLAGK